MYLEKYYDYLEKEKKMSKNSIEAYKGDILNFFNFIKRRGMTKLEETTNTEIVAYLMSLKNEDKSPSTTNRKLASVRAFFNYLQSIGVVINNPTKDIKSPKIERKGLEYLTVEEVDTLLEAPDDSVKGKRDKAILEVMYATGIRVNEIIGANVKDVNIRIGFLTCPGEHGKARIVPMGRPARETLGEYLFSSRGELVHNGEEEALFVNYYGKRMTRQGLWKILKEYGNKVGIEKNITPHTLRNSFAVHMIQNGADLKSIQELLGHEDLTATQIYLSVTKNKIKDVYDKSHPRA